MTKNYTPLISCLECQEVFSSKGIFKHLLNTHDKISSRDPGKGSQKFLKDVWCINCKYQTTLQNLSRHTCAKPKKPKRIKKIKPISLFVQLSPKTYCKVSYCSVCNCVIRNSNKRTCSVEHTKIARNLGASKGGKLSASIQVKRSKDEILLYELLASKFKNVSHNEPIFNGWDADIILNDHKTAIMWNGPWHYKEMKISNHSLKQVQNRDSIKAKEILALGWKLFVFEDREYSPQTAFDFVLSNLSDAGTGNAPISDQAYETCRVT